MNPAPRPQDEPVPRAADAASGCDDCITGAMDRTTESIAVFRILDAAANRAREGLRVVEDYVRFVLDDRHLTEQFKRLRHEFAAVLERIPIQQGLAARETQADVGTTFSTPSEQSRSNAAGVLTANLLRLEESLRSLEEFGKLLDAAMAADLERLRYRVYTLQRAVEITRGSLERLETARLYVLLDGGKSPDELQRLAGHVLAAALTCCNCATNRWMIGN